MTTNEIAQFNESRVQIRAYLVYLMQKNIPCTLPSITLDTVLAGVKSLRREIDFIEALYILDAQGVQVSDTISSRSELRKKDKGTNRSHRAYYYKAVREKKAILTDPYPSLLTNRLTVSVSMPIYNEKKQLQYIAVVDIALKDIEKIVYPDFTGRTFINFNKIAYAVFSVALLGISFLLLFKSMITLLEYGFNPSGIDLKHIFESTILLTLALAIFDLVKTIFEEEVLGRHKKGSSLQNKTMAKFIGSIIIALAIEALMLVFKSALTDPSQLVYALYLIGGVTVLIVALAYYIKNTNLKTEESKGR